MEISNEAKETFTTREFRADDLYNNFDLPTLQLMVKVCDNIITSLKNALSTMTLRNANDKYQEALIILRLDNVVNNRAIVNASIKFDSLKLPTFSLN